MIQKAKKKTLFLISVSVTGVLGIIGGYISSNYSRDGSFLVPIAKADIPATGGIEGAGTPTVDAGSGDGSGGGGGSGGDCSSSSCY